jgi:hypothetical protein
MCAINYSYYCEIEVFENVDEVPDVKMEDLEICEENE